MSNCARIWAVCWPVLLLALAGCISVARPTERPAVSVQALSAAPAGDMGLEVRLELDIQNPNDYLLTARAFDWHLDIDGAVQARGRTQLSLALPARSRERGLIAMRVPAGAVAPVWGVSLGGRAVHVRGTLHLSSKRGDLGVVVDEVGTLASTTGLLPSRRERHYRRSGRQAPPGSLRAAHP